MADRDAAPGSVRIDAAGAAAALVRVIPGGTGARDTGTAPGNDAATTTMRLRRRADDRGSGSTTADLLEYRQFRDAAARAGFLQTSTPGPHTDTAYDLAELIVPDGARQLVVEPGHLIQVVTITTPRLLVAEALKFNSDETRRYFRTFAGFVGVAMHVGPAGGEPDRMLEISVWRSADHLARATSTDDFREHVRDNARLARHLDLARYDLMEPNR